MAPPSPSRVSCVVPVIVGALTLALSAAASPEPAATAPLLRCPPEAVVQSAGSEPVPFPFTLVAGLPVAELSTPYLRYRFQGVSQEEAELLFAESTAALYMAEWGEVWILTRPEQRGMSAAWSALTERPAAAPWELAERRDETSLEAFLGDVAAAFPGLQQGAYGRYVLMTPSRRRGPAAAARAQMPPARANGTVVSEGFESDPWGRWQRWDDGSGQFTWEVTTCDAHSGSRSADAVRGGSLGPSLGCDAVYPNSVETWFEDSQCESLSGASQAWFDVFINQSSESGYDALGFYFEGSGNMFYGIGFTGNTGGWFHLIANLRQWYKLGDLTQQSCNTLAVIFDSDSTTATGFGARVDDITIRTDSAPAPTCAASATPQSGTAPLSVSFTGSVSGTTSPSYSWSFGDGGSASTQNAAHTYTAPGDYEARFRVIDGASRCYSWLPITVQSGGGGGVQPQAGTYLGTSAQGRPVEFDVDGNGRLTRWKVDYACGSSSGWIQVSSPSGCAVTNGSFSCGSDSCPTVGGAVKLAGTFATSTSASGTFNLAIRPSPSSSCCTLTGVTWSATLQGGASLTATASANPTSGQAPLAVNFTGGASGGTPPYSYSWSFDDGSSSTSQNPSHTYTSPGTYTATLTVTDSAAASSIARRSFSSATDSVTITVSSPPSSAYRYLIAAIAHNPGAGGTMWRTDVAAAYEDSGASATDISYQPANLTLTYHSPAGDSSTTTSLSPGATVEWSNILESLFALASSASSNGSLEITSNVPLAIAARTFNQTPAGTFGQYLPALTEADALTSGQLGVLPQIKKNAAFRTNIGALNLGSDPCTVLVTLYNAAGTAVGSFTISLQPNEWKQVNDVFATTGAGTQNIAYATVQVQTHGGKAWVYASVVDAVTGDPTTIPVLMP